MRIVFLGGTGVIGAKVVSLHRESGNTVVAGSPATGINTIMGAGLADAM